MSEFDKREQWFVDRVGKRVYRNDTQCTCGVCKGVYEHGLIINDYYHATYLCEIEATYTAEGHPTQYFDSIEERDKFELELKSGN